MSGGAGARVLRPEGDLQLSFLELGRRRSARGMIRDERLKPGRLNFATHSLSHQNQNRSFSNGSRLNWRMMRKVAGRASRVRTPRMVVREVRLRGHKKQ